MTTILMVDDEKDIDVLISQRFRKEIKEGVYTFVFARNGQDALREIQKNPQISIVLTDIHMPQMNGIELILKIKETYPALRTIIISAYADQESMDAAREAGATAFITKPIYFKEFEAILAALSCLENEVGQKNP